MTASTDLDSISVSATTGSATGPVYDPVADLARDLSLSTFAVRAVVELLDQGNTVPFIARYRKEKTGGLDEVSIRAIEERRSYRQELEQRRAAVLASIAEQGKLTDPLAAAIKAAETKAVLEDLYLPYKQKRKTRASIARERGLDPLALRILTQPSGGDAAVEAAAFVNTDVPTGSDALAGARDIVAEVVAETAVVRAYVRSAFSDQGEIVSERAADVAAEPTKFEQYYEFREAVQTIPSHRFLAIRRGEAEGVLRAHIAPGGGVDTVVAGIERLMVVDLGSPWAGLLREAIGDAYKRLLAPAVENDVRAEIKLRSDTAAVEVFADNLKNLLLSPPLGSRAVIGIDPGLRTGCKCAAVDATGKYLASITIFLTQGEAALLRAGAELGAFIEKWNPVAIAVGNGTGGRDAEGFVRKLLAAAEPAAAATAGTVPSADVAQDGIAPLVAAEEAAPQNAPAAPQRWVVAVNEAGASVYSASDVAREEFPDLDLTIRGAISIARRLQDPLAELVKIEPKAIGVGQYQHDVHQPLLTRKLDDVVESCVNHVGVELNTASTELLSYVAGIGKSLAKKIVTHRAARGGFGSRQQLLEVTGLGPKAFEQCAGFLRIHGGDQPLDGSAVHPERYRLVERMAADLGVGIAEIVGNQALVLTIDLSRYSGDGVGESTLRDIVGELAKAGRDPRAEFTPPKFRDDVQSMGDLKEGMVLEGVVTNVTAFGAFVDVGVHQDGLVHISRLSGRFVKDAAEVVKVGDRITVRVLSVDMQRRRIGLDARPPEAPRNARPAPRQGQRGGDRPVQGQVRDGNPGGQARDGRGPRGPRRDERNAAGTPGASPGTRTDAGPANESRGPRPGGDGGNDHRPGGQGGGPGGGGRGPSGGGRGPSGGGRGPSGGGRGPSGGGRGPSGGGRGPNSGRDQASAPRRDQDAGVAPGRDQGGAVRPPQNHRSSDDRGGRPGGQVREDRNVAGEGTRPPRDDRRDDRGTPDKPGVGVGGFVNNPFAKLVDRKR